MPDAVPVAVDVAGVAEAADAALALVEHLLVELRAQRVHDEHVGRARVLEGVEDDLEVVLL